MSAGEGHAGRLARAAGGASFYVRGTFIDVLGTIAFVFICHDSTYYFYRGLRHERQNEAAWRRVTGFAFALGAAVCLSFGASAFALLLDATQPNVLSNFAAGDVAANAARGLVVLQLCLTSPICLYSARMTCNSLVSYRPPKAIPPPPRRTYGSGRPAGAASPLTRAGSRSREAGADGERDPQGRRSPGDAKPETPFPLDEEDPFEGEVGTLPRYEAPEVDKVEMSLARHCALTAGLVAAAVAVALTIDLRFAFELTGGVCASFLAFVIPAACYLRLVPDRSKFGRRSPREAVSMMAILAFGVCIMLVCTCRAVWSRLASVPRI